MKNNGEKTPSAIPFVVDLDGTLVRTDLLWEGIVLFLRAYPLEIWRLVCRLFSGKVAFKTWLASRVAIDPSRLPYNEPLLTALRGMQQQGRPLILATGSHARFAEPVAAHLGLFGTVIATQDDVNMTSTHKAQALATRFGAGGYDYIGNDTVDIPVWEGAREAFSVSPRAFVLQGGGTTQPMAVVQPYSARALLRAMRPRQWLKNLLVFVPVLAGHALTPGPWMYSLWAFVGFCLCASSAYLVNDTLDAQEDRMHRIKKSRPIAAGTLSIPVALVAAVGFVALACAIGLAVGGPLLAVLAIYYGLTTTYSIWLKRLLLLDVITLSMLYILRVVGGGAAAGIVLSFWLLAFLLFILLSLALLKRHSELHHLESIGQESASGRGYRVSDAIPVAAMGIASGFLGTLVFMLYVNSEAVTALYGTPLVLMAVTPLLVYWHCRIWVLSFRGAIHEDPVFFISKDPVSRAVLILTAVIAIFATFL